MRASDALGERFARDHPEHAAGVLERAAPEDAAAFVTSVDDTTATALVQHMNASLAAATLSALDLERAAGLIESLPLNAAARVLRHLDPTTVEKLLQRVRGDTAKPLSRLLRYREGTAGALADPRALTLPAEMNVGDARKQLRRLAGVTSYHVYITDPDHRLIGVLTIRELFQARPKQRLETIMQRQPVRLPANADLLTVATHPSWQHFETLPVVDRSDGFLGVLRHKTIRRLADARETRPGPAVLFDVALGIAEMYWRSMSGLAAGLSAAANTQSDERPHSRRR